MEENLNPAVVEAPEAAPIVPPPADPQVEPAPKEPVEGETPAAPIEAAPYTPNFKVKAYDKEFEIPEEFRSLIKDADSEKKVRDIFEKAYGLDGMKERYTRTKEDFGKAQEVLGKYAEQDRTIDFLGKCVEKKDFGTYFDTLGIDRKDLQKWMLQELQTAELPPEQQAIYNRERELQKRAYALEAENQKYKTQVESSQEEGLRKEGERRVTELTTVITSQPEISAVAKAFDARKGNGAFFELVRKTGLTAYQTEGKDLTVQEAVAQVMDLLGPGQAQAAKVASVAEAKAKPVLPIVEGRSLSPTAKKPNSVEDLRKMAAAMSDAD
jgi:hypothetical protein